MVNPSLYLPVLLLLLVVPTTVIQAACPHADGSLKPWSAASSWTSGIPAQGAPVVIGSGMNILLDVSPAASSSITVINGGKLVWGDVDGLTLTSGYILIKEGGQMWIGSEDCKFSKRATINLTGTARSTNVTDFGNKFIGVSSGGTLEMHGAAYTPTWTQLTKSIKPMSYASTSASRGINIATFDATTAAFVAYRGFDTHINTSNSDALAAYVNGLPANTIVAAVSSDEAGRSINDAAKTALRTLGCTLISSLAYRDAWICIGVKGAAAGSAIEIIRNETQRPTPIVTRTVSSSNGNTILISARSEEFYAWIKAQDQTQSILSLANNVNWKVGQRVVVASTDGNYMHAEESTIVACPTCSANQIKLEDPFQWVHWGEKAYGVDTRAEVGLLSRNILVQGVMANDDDTWGAVSKVMNGFTNAHFENVEFYNVGQPILAMYPVHFHMVGDVDRLGGYTNPAYVKGCSVHRSFSRCFTLHGVNGLLVQDNVAYDHVGHCYFIEDGAEMRNQLVHNLGLGTHFGSLLLSERHGSTCQSLPNVDPAGCHGPATFWLTNGANDMIGNSAAGSAFMGIWYVFPARPTGPSYALYPNLPIANLPLGRAENNVVHDAEVGIMVDDGVVVDETSPNYLGINGARFRPHVNGSMSLPRVPAVFNGLTVHHIKRQGVWMRGGELRIVNGYFADNAIGCTLASEGGMPNDPGSSQELHNGIFVGKSENPLNTGNFPVRGFEIYDGPVRCINCSFFNFVPTKSANISAFGFLIGNNWQLSPTSYIEKATFDSQSLRINAGGNPPYFSNLNDGERNTIIHDRDGSITGIRDSRLVTPYPVHTTKLCTYREDWNLSICPHKYTQLFIRNNAPGNTNYGSALTNAGIHLVRDETSTYKMYMEGIPSGIPTNTYQPMVIVNKNYTLHWNHAPPTDVNIQMTNFDTEDWVRIGVCFPTSATVTATYIVGNRRYDLTSVSSIGQLSSSPNVTSFYWDRAAGLAFVILKTQYARDGDNYCGIRGCESVQFQATGTNTGLTSTAPGYCAGAYPKYAVVDSSTPGPTQPPPFSTSTTSSQTSAATANPSSGPSSSDSGPSSGPSSGPTATGSTATGPTVGGGDALNNSAVSLRSLSAGLLMFALFLLM